VFRLDRLGGGTVETSLQYGKSRELCATAMTKTAVTEPG
jgi:hypothetical protein